MDHHETLWKDTVWVKNLLNVCVDPGISFFTFFKIATHFYFRSEVIYLGSLIYEGASLLRALFVRSRNLNYILNYTGSQGREAKTGVI